jgi:hypothetical protein
MAITLVLTGISHKNIDEEKKYYPLHIFYSIIAASSGIGGITLFNIAFMYEDATKISIIKTIG